MSLTVAPSPFKVTEALLRVAGQFLHMINPPCERFVVVDDLQVAILPGPGASIDDEIEMVRRAAEFLDCGLLISPTRTPTTSTVTISARGSWSEVPFLVQTTLLAEQIPSGLLDQATAVTS